MAIFRSLFSASPTRKSLKTSKQKILTFILQKYKLLKTGSHIWLGRFCKSWPSAVIQGSLYYHAYVNWVQKRWVWYNIPVWNFKNVWWFNIKILFPLCSISICKNVPIKVKDNLMFFFYWNCSFHFLSCVSSMQLAGNQFPEATNVVSSWK